MIFLIIAIIFLFTVYVCSREDYVFLRKNIALSAIFDVVILCGIISLLFSRILFISIHPSVAYFNPLIFFIIPYFPGLSGVGFLLGGYVSLYFLTIQRKMPTARIYDIFSFATLMAVASFFLEKAIIEIVHKMFLSGGIHGLFSLLCILLFLFLHNRFLKSSWADGTITFLTTSCVCLLLLVSEAMLLKFASLPLESVYFVFFFFLLFFTFLVKSFRKIKGKV